MLGGRLLPVGDSDFLTSTGGHDSGSLRIHRDEYLSDECWPDEENNVEHSRSDDWDPADIHESADRPSSDDDNRKAQDFSKGLESESNLGVDDEEAGHTQPSFGRAKRRRVAHHEPIPWTHQWSGEKEETDPGILTFSGGEVSDSSHSLAHRPPERRSVQVQQSASPHLLAVPSHGQQGMIQLPPSFQQEQSTLQDPDEPWGHLPIGLGSGFGHVSSLGYGHGRNVSMRMFPQPRRRELVPFTVNPRPVGGSGGRGYYALAQMSDGLFSRGGRIEPRLQMAGPRIRPCRTSLPTPSLARLIGRGFARPMPMFQSFPGNCAFDKTPRDFPLQQDVSQVTYPQSQGFSGANEPTGVQQEINVTPVPLIPLPGRRTNDGLDDESLAVKYDSGGLSQCGLSHSSTESPTIGSSIPNSPPQQHQRDDYGVSTFAAGQLNATPESIYARHQQDGADQLSPDASNPTFEFGRNRLGWRSDMTQKAVAWEFGTNGGERHLETQDSAWGITCPLGYRDTALMDDTQPRLGSKMSADGPDAEFPAQSAGAPVAERPDLINAYLTRGTSDAGEWLKCESPDQVDMANLESKVLCATGDSSSPQQGQHQSDNSAENLSESTGPSPPYSSSPYPYQSEFLGLFDSKAFSTSNCDHGAQTERRLNSPLQVSLPSSYAYSEQPYEWLPSDRQPQSSFYNGVYDHLQLQSAENSLFTTQAQNALAHMTTDQQRETMDLTTAGGPPYPTDPHHHHEFVPPGLDSLNNEYRKLLKNIPRKSREAFSPSDEAAFRTCHPHYSRNCFILMHNGYDIRLGEIGRASLKKEISKRLKGDAQLRERCVSIVCRLKNANVLQLLQMAEIAGCLSLGLKISSSYWKDYSRKQRPGGGIGTERHSSVSSGTGVRLQKSRTKKRNVKEALSNNVSGTQTSAEYLAGTTGLEQLSEYSKDNYDQYGRMDFIDPDHPTANPFSENILINPNFQNEPDKHGNSGSPTILSLENNDPLPTNTALTTLVDSSKTALNDSSSLSGPLSDSLNSLLCRYGRSQSEALPTPPLSHALPSRDMVSHGGLPDQGAWLNHRSENLLSGTRLEAYHGQPFPLEDSEAQYGSEPPFHEINRRNSSQYGSEPPFHEINRRHSSSAFNSVLKPEHDPSFATRVHTHQ